MDPPQTPRRLFGVYVISLFSLENKTFGIHQTSFCLLRHLSFQSWKHLWCILFSLRYLQVCLCCVHADSASAREHMSWLLPEDTKMYGELSVPKNRNRNRYVFNLKSQIPNRNSHCKFCSYKIAERNRGMKSQIAAFQNRKFQMARFLPVKQQRQVEGAQTFRKKIATIFWGRDLKSQCFRVFESGVDPTNQTEERAKTKSSWISPIFVNSGVFLWKKARFTSNFCSGLPPRKVHELAFLWFGLPGWLLIEIAAFSGR